MIIFLRSGVWGKKKKKIGFPFSLYLLFKLAKLCKETRLSFVCALPFGTILNTFQEREKKILT